MLNDALRYLSDHVDSNLARLDELLRVPSISTDAARKPDVRRAAHWIHEFFQSCGLAARILETPVHPCVVADSGPLDNKGPTLLVYGHYDVEPAGDLTLWDSPPFEPDVRNGSVFARGVSDDKGQLLAHLLAAEAWLKTAGSLPVRVKYLIEGEEEIGSPSMQGILAGHCQELACDYVVVSDGWKFDADTPTIVYATRGCRRPPGLAARVGNACLRRMPRRCLLSTGELRLQSGYVGQVDVTVTVNIETVAVGKQ